MTRDPFSVTSPQILPSILSADFAKLGSDIKTVLNEGADFLHLDIMDGHFVPNISFGPAVVAAARSVTEAYLDAHLMISEPARYAPALVKAGAQNITFHIEAVADAVQTVKAIRDLGCHVGITLRPATPVEAIWPVVELVDVVLVMSVVPGFSGQSFMPEVLPKARAIHKRLRADQRLEMDGGLHAQTIAQAAAAGVDWFVVGSGVFGAKDRAAAILELKQRVMVKAPEGTD